MYTYYVSIQNSSECCNRNMNLNNYFQSHFYIHSTFTYSRNKQHWIINGRNSQHSANHCSNFPLTHNLCLFIVLGNGSALRTKQNVCQRHAGLVCSSLLACSSSPAASTCPVIYISDFQVSSRAYKRSSSNAIGGQRKWRVTPRQTIQELLCK